MQPRSLTKSNRPGARRWVLLSVLSALALAEAGWAAGETVIPLSDPNRPARLQVSLIEGDIEVEGYDGKDVILITEGAEDEGDHEVRDGLRRLPKTSFGLIAEEEGNVVSVEMNGTSDEVTLRVPRRTSLMLSTINDGDIEVMGVEGDHELNNTNGDIRAVGLSGSVQAVTVNGEVEIELVRSNGSPMSFSSLNGDVDVTLPANLGARFELQTMNGEVFTDFDVKLDTSAPTTERTRVANRFRVEIQQVVSGTVNGGGAVIRMQSHNGDILIRRSE